MTDVDDALALGPGRDEDRRDRRTRTRACSSPAATTRSDYAKTDKWLKYCKPTYEKYTHKVAPGPLDKVPGPDGKQLDTYGSINDACQTHLAVPRHHDQGRART